MKTHLILASMSPRRIELMRNLKLEFEIIPSNIEEIVDPNLLPSQLVINLAYQKATKIYDRVVGTNLSNKTTLVLAADTIVVLDGKFFGKPTSREDAIGMLKMLSGRCHEVYTGVCLLGTAQNPEEKSIKIDEAIYEVSRVYFKQLSHTEIEAYVDSSEPNDKAGAYALQGIGAAFVEKIEGCFTNIIGLPVPKVVTLLRKAGLNVLNKP